jgi:hypothetical protein
MSLKWVAFVLSMTGIVAWFEGSRQELGFVVFLIGGSMWLLAQEISSVQQDLKKFVDDKNSGKK